LAADLAGAHLRDLPPLVDLLPLADPDPGSVPLRLQFRGSGPFAAALVLRRDGVRRQAVVLASGFWRWAARDVEGRDAYRRLWSGVAGWLMEKDPGGAAREARPERRVFAPGQEVRWRIPGEGGDSVRLRVMAAGDTVLDTLVTAGPAVAVGALPPGSYAYQVHGPGNARSEGRFDVEDRTLEMLPVRAAPSAGGAAPGAGDGATGASVGAVRGSRPLRTTPWPYLLILGLLCAEWVGRRRAGLR
jgi:hypothetical protein